MPTREVKTRGNKQYPSTEADRESVRVLEKCDDPIDEPGGGCECEAALEEGSSGGDIRDIMAWRDVLPRRARP